MFVASSRNTMANARPKFRATEAEIVSLAELERMREELARLKRIEEERERVQGEIDAANKRLVAFNGGEKGVVRFNQICRRICRALKVNKEELLSDRRHKEIAFARQAIFYWATRRTRLSHPEIGRRMGGKDHTTVLHGSRVYPKKRAAMGRNLRAVR